MSNEKSNNTDTNSLPPASPGGVDRDHLVPVHNEAQDPPEVISRRRFLNKLSFTLAGVGAVITGVPVVAYIVAPLFKESPDIWRPVGPVDKYQIGSTQEVSFEDSSPLPWAGVTALTAAWLRRETADSFVAFAVNCTHLGCPVSWLPGAKLFMCPCHGGVYYPDGKVAAGPPPEELFRYPTRIRNGQVEIQATGVPIATK